MAEEKKADFNTFSYHFAAFNILFGFFGLPLYQYLMVTGDRSRIKEIYTTNKVCTQLLLVAMTVSQCAVHFRSQCRGNNLISFGLLLRSALSPFTHDVGYQI